MNEFQTIVDHASSQSDRWLFLAMLAILLTFVFLAWRWMVSDRESLAKQLAVMTERYIDESKKFCEVVTNNTTVMRQVSDVMVACRLHQSKP